MKNVVTTTKKAKFLLRHAVGSISYLIHTSVMLLQYLVKRSYSVLSAWMVQKLTVWIRLCTINFFLQMARHRRHWRLYFYFTYIFWRALFVFRFLWYVFNKRICIDIQGGQKNRHTILYVLTSYAIISSNTDRFSNLFFTVWIRRTFVIILLIKIPPHLKCVGRYTTAWNVSVFKATTENKTTAVTTYFEKLTTECHVFIV